MKQKLNLFAILAITMFFPSIAIADTDGELEGTVILQESQPTTGPKRVPHRRMDIILIITQTEIQVHFSRDFGHGHLHLVDNTTNEEVFDELYASSEDFYSLNFDTNQSSNLDFTIEFDSGEWCHLTWNN